jgi:hypothetical protein
MFVRDAFSQQRVGDRQHAAGGQAHEEAHNKIAQKSRHRTADSGTDKHNPSK